jgi:hypothetical protein
MPLCMYLLYGVQSICNFDHLAIFSGGAILTAILYCIKCYALLISVPIIYTFSGGNRLVSSFITYGVDGVNPKEESATRERELRISDVS